jgi:Outer membrane receptor proteins, mostly Fe transport
MTLRLAPVNAKEISKLDGEFNILFFKCSYTKNLFDTVPQDTAKNPEDMTLQELARVMVSPFEVSSQLDSGYRAANSISASRIDAPIYSLPFAVQAFTDSFIIDQKPVNIFDVARYSPGVTYRSNDFNEGNANMSVRGFAIGSIEGGNIPILRDGFHGPSIFDFTNISRVEIVKGPASFLYGQLAPGGIVNVITKNPREKFEASLDFLYGSYNQFQSYTDITGPISKTLFYRWGTSFVHDIEYWKPYNANSRNIAPSLLWKPSNKVSISIKYESFYKDEEPQVMQKPGYNTQAGILPTPSDPNLSGVDVPGLPDNWNSMSFADFRRSSAKGLSTWIDFRADSHWNIRGGYSYQDYKIDALASGNFGMSNNTTFMQGRRFRHQIYSNTDNTFQIDAAGKYKLGGANLMILLGGQYVKRKFDRSAGQAPNDPKLGNDPIASPLPLWDLRDPSTWNRVVNIPLSELTSSLFNQNIAYTDKSGYIGINLGFFKDKLNVLAGERYTSTNSQLTDNLKNMVEPKIFVDIISPQYGLLYSPVRGISFFYSYSESFVPGTLLINNLDGTISTAKPTRGYGYDIGMKTNHLNGHLSGTLTWFNIRNKNIINDLSVTNNAGIVTIYNVQSGEQRSRGIELDATITFEKNWQLYLSYSYMNARITQFSGNDEAILALDPNKLDIAGQTNYKTIKRFYNAPLQMSAPHLANIWTRYNFSKTYLKKLYLAGGANFVFDQTILPDSPKSSNQTYTLVNASTGYCWTLCKFELHIDFMAKNILNMHYRPSQSTRSRPREFLIIITGNL